MLVLPTFFNDRFTSGWIAISVYVILIFSGIIWTGYYASQKMKINPLYLLGIIILLDFGVYKSFYIVKNNIESFSSLKESYHHFYTTYLRSIPVYQTDLGRYHTDLFYTLKPGNSVNENLEFSNAYSVNSQGLRASEVALGYPEIIVLGDSHTMGFGVNQEEVYANKIEQLSGKKTLNAGMISYGTAREYLLFQQLKTDSCKTIILQYCPNDAIENKLFLGNNNQLKISSERAYQFCCYRNVLLANYYPFKYIFEATAHQFRKLKFWDKHKNPNIDLTTQTKNVFAIIELLQEDYKGKIVLFNLETMHTTNELFLEFEKYIKHHNLKNIQCIDFSKTLQQQDFNIIDEHINASGHEKIGTQIFELMEN